MSLLASELFAISQGSVCIGRERCHWCSAPCEKTWFHDDAPMLPFIKHVTRAKIPSSPFICVGCWLFRRNSVTVKFLDNKEFKDRQTAQKHSWWITDKEALAIRKEDYSTLYTLILNPPHTFSLILADNLGPKDNMAIHLALANDESIIKASTQLQFTINSIPMKYSVYELEEAIKHGAEGKEPGVQALLKLLGEPPDIEKLKVVQEKRERGRPPALDSKAASKTIKKSGY